MGTIFLIITIILSIFIVMFAQYNQADMTLSMMYSDINFKMTFLAYTTIVYALGLTGGVMIMLKGVFEANSQYMHLKKRLEKTTIGADDSDLKVKTLENKIKTLEAALERTLNNKEDK